MQTAITIVISPKSTKWAQKRPFQRGITVKSGKTRCLPEKHPGEIAGFPPCTALLGTANLQTDSKPTTSLMPKGLSLHIGVNYYDNKSYRQIIERPIPPLPNCDRDAMAKKAIADRFAYTSALLINKDATATEVTKGIAAAGDYLDDGDMFFLSFSGHGSRMKDRNGDEDDGYDETWCLYDQMLVDDDLFELLKRFRPGVRVLIIADSCHSGTSAKDLFEEVNRPGGEFPLHKTGDVLASCLLMAACQDAGQAMAPGNMGYSLYTHWMLKILERYAFCDSYRELHNRISRQMPSNITPNLFPFGPGAHQFMQRRPFQI